MQARLIADMKQADQAEDREHVRCAAVKPTQADRQKREVLRFVVVGVALLAVLLLIAIAFYYTRGNAVTIKRVSLLAPQVTMRV